MPAAELGDCEGKIFLLKHSTFLLQMGTRSGLPKPVTSGKTLWMDCWDNQGDFTRGLAPWSYSPGREKTWHTGAGSLTARLFDYCCVVVVILSWGPVTICSPDAYFWGTLSKMPPPGEVPPGVLILASKGDILHAGKMTSHPPSLMGELGCRELDACSVPSSPLIFQKASSRLELSLFSTSFFETGLDSNRGDIFVFSSGPLCPCLSGFRAWSGKEGK